MLEPKISRFGNAIYRILFEKIAATVDLSAVQCKRQNDLQQIAQKTIKYLPDGDAPSPLFEIYGRTYKWERKSPNFFEKLASTTSSIFLPATKHEANYSLVPILFADASGLEFVPKAGIPITVSPPPAEEVRPLSTSFDLKADRFADPYTELAAKAFQEIEHRHFSDSKLSESDTCIVKVGDHLRLQANKHNGSLNSISTAHYHSELVNLYGKEKIDSIQHLYQFNLEEMTQKGEALTPEHVYRMNIGLTNIEAHDIELFYNHLRSLQKDISHQSENTPLIDLLEHSNFLNGNEARCLLKLLGLGATVTEFLEWMKKFGPDDMEFETLPFHHQELLASSLAIQPEERESALTGRAILDPILGWYQTGNLEEYKPWLDQQQLTQVFAEYEQTDNWEAFHEILSFVIVKLHLARPHPTEGYRVGVLIPTPKDPEGNTHWLKVTSCVSNGKGTFSYTLEGLGSDTPLTSIKLYRSTAVSPYCMHGQATVLSDLNPFNSPGYLGKGLADEYERRFFEDRSIPIWVGYTMRAQELLQGSETRGPEHLRELTQALVDATRHLREAELKPFRTNSMRDILRRHDAVLVDMLLHTSKFSDVLPSFLHLPSKLTWWAKDILEDFPTLAHALAERYIHQEHGTVDQKTKSDAESLIQCLKSYRSRENTTEEKKTEIDAMIHDIEDHILDNKEKLDEYEQHSDLFLEKYHDLLADVQTLSAVDLKDSDLKLHDAYMKAEALTKTLDFMAKQRNEHHSQKNRTGVNFLGHSLGGSCAQIHLVHFYSASNRIPLPGQDLKLFEYDAPGINATDNKDFIQFGNTHANLLEALNITFSINRSQESGDPTPFGGESHLGAMERKDESQALGRWLNFNASVYERLDSAITPSVAFSREAHGTRFRLGKEGVDYKRIPYNASSQDVIDKGKSSEAKAMKDTIWKIGLFANYLDESFRRSINNMILYATLMMTPSPGEDNQCDKKGVLAISDHGVESKLNRSK